MTFKLFSPLITSIGKVRNSVAIELVLLTTVRIFLFLSIITSPIIFLYGNNSSLKLKCAICPTVSKCDGTSVTVSGNI